jgi:hypothetical protein
MGSGPHGWPWVEKGVLGSGALSTVANRRSPGAMSTGLESRMRYMGERHNEAITGVAAGVPFTALPPTVAVEGPAPLVLAWHMLGSSGLCGYPVGPYRREGIGVIAFSLVGVGHGECHDRLVQHLGLPAVAGQHPWVRSVGVHPCQ